jgi:outer membrane protein TolC
MQVEDRAGHGSEALYAATQALMGRAMQEPSLAGLLSSFDINVPQLHLDVDRERAKALGIPLHEVFDTLQIQMGSLYVNDFNRFGRTYQVNVQADAAFRSNPEDIGRLRVRNEHGELASLGSLVRTETSFGPDRVMRYNGYPSADLGGGAAPGVSTGEAVATMERLAAEVLPSGMSFEWTELTLQEKLAGSAGTWVFPLAVLLAYLILAAQYNSWTLPLAVLLIVPLALLSAIAGVWLTGGANDIFTQIGCVVLVGLAAKNAILIVEFAREREAQGRDPWTAALEACRLRLRPIVMTSLAFIMGVVPLALATGAGAEMRRAMGIAVLFGMLGVTLFGLVLTPVFYVVIRGLSLKLGSAKTATRLAGTAAVLGLVWLSESQVAVAQATEQPARVVELSLNEALELAFKNNLAVRQASLTSEIAATQVQGARSVFDPVLGGKAEYVRDRQPPRVFAGPTGIETFGVETSLTQQLPWGTAYEVAYGFDRIEAEGPFVQADPTYGARVRLGVRQSLLRGAWGIPERTAIESAERSQHMADATLRSDTNSILLGAAAAYYRLVLARENLGVARDSRKLAAELVHQTRAQVQAGTLERVELVQAEAGLALREETVIVAEAEVANAQDALARTLLLDSEHAFAVEIHPTDGVPSEIAEAQLDVHLAGAWQHRSELIALGIAVRNEQAAVRLARNRELPDLAAVGSVAAATSASSLGNAHDELPSRVDDQYRWSAGLTFSYPLGNRAAESSHRAAQLTLQKAETALADAKLAVEQDVRAAVRSVNASVKRIEATRTAERLASEQLSAEKSRLEAGLSTSFQVLRLETDLSTARLARVRATTDYAFRKLDLARAVGQLHDRHGSVSP